MLTNLLLASGKEKQKKHLFFFTKLKNENVNFLILKTWDINRIKWWKCLYEQ